ncbi:MAG: hypothetical protein ACYCOU_08320 [Sulfobacillus sp.]
MNPKSVAMQPLLEFETERLWWRQRVDGDIWSRVEIPCIPKTLFAEAVRARVRHGGAKDQGKPIMGQRCQIGKS